MAQRRHAMYEAPMARGAEYRSGARVAEELCTVEFAAQQLKLHPKTILRFIREGRLPATRVGKAFRILRSDLQAFAGLPARPAVEPATATCIVDLPGVGSELAQTLARLVPAALNGERSEGPPARADVIYDPDRSHLKIVLVGSPQATAGLMNLIQLWMEQQRV